MAAKNNMVFIIKLPKNVPHHILIMEQYIVSENFRNFGFEI